MAIIDQAQQVRDGEEFDVGAMDAYLKDEMEGVEGTPEVRQFPSGASNLTYLVRYDGRDLVLRRPPFGTKAKSAHDMNREVTVLRGLKPVYPYVPEVLVHCTDHDVIGIDFYVMERIRGVIPRQEMPDELDLDEAQTAALCRNVVDKLIELHKVDYEAAGLEDLGRGEGYVQRQIEGWTKRWRAAKTEDAADFEDVITWLEDHMPDGDVDICVIHNDFRLDNIILDPDNPTEVIAVLDWEMSTLGDPLMDLGNTLAYWVQSDDDAQFQFMRRQPSHLPGMMTRQEIIDYYCDEMGYEVDDFDFYIIYGLFRLAVIVQQIYYRFYHGQTQDDRFAAFVHVATYLEQRCLRLIAESDQ